MISIILPAYNEAKRLRDSVEKIVEYLKENVSEFEIIIAEDGSKDGTDRIARELAERYEFIRHLHSKERLGRGKALNNAIRNAKYEFVLYMDVDLSTDLKHIGDVLKALNEGYDIAIGSRLLRESDAARPLYRDIPSRIYNFLVRSLLGSKIRDHQCGFKAFRKSKIIELLDEIKDNHWFWDTEILVLAQRKGLKIAEIPVKWRHGGKSKVNLTRDSIYMFKNIIRLMK